MEWETESRELTDAFLSLLVEDLIFRLRTPLSFLDNGMCCFHMGFGKQYGPSVLITKPEEK